MAEFEEKLAEAMAGKGADQDTNSSVVPPSEGKQPTGTQKLFTIKRGNETLQLTEDELVARAQKGWDAEEKYQAAANSRKFEEDVMAARAGDVAATIRVAQRMGYSQDDVQKMLDEARGQKTNQSPNPQKAAGGEDDEYQQLLDDVASLVAKKMGGGQKKQVALGDLDPRVQQALNLMYGDKIEGYIQKTIDNDPVLGDYGKHGSPEQKDAVLGMVKERVQRRVQAGQDVWSPNTVTTALQEVRQELARLGVQPAKKAERVPFPGLGPSEGSMSGSFHPDKPAERPKDGVFDKNGSNYVLDRLLHLQMQNADEE